MNIRGLIKNYHELKNIIEKYNPDVITLQETLTKKTMNLKNYNIFYKNREFSKGGGLCTYVNKHYHAHSAKFSYNDNINDKEFEVLIVKIKTGDSFIRIINTYINPKTTTDLSDLFDSLYCDKNTLILGDMNAKHPKWCISNKSNKKGIALNNIMGRQDLFVHNKYTKTLINNFGKKSTVDLIITKKHSNISIDKIDVLKKIGSDHYPILFDFSFVFKINKHVKKMFDYKKMDVENYVSTLKSMLPVFLLYCYNCDNVDNLFNFFRNIFFLATKKTTPIKTIRYKYKNNGNKWWNEDIEKNIKLKNKLRKKLWRHRSIINYENYKNQCKYVKKLIKKYKSQFWNKINSEKNLADIMKTVSSLKNKKIIQFTLKTNNGTKHEPKKIANTINSYLRNVPRKLISLNNEKDTSNISKKIINNIEPVKFKKVDHLKLNEKISTNDIYTQIKNLNVKKAIGYDKLEQEMFKRSIDVSKLYLSALINYCYENKKLPKLFKLGKVIPIPKEEGNVVDIEKIRPISLLSVVSKIMEKIILNRLNQVIEKYKIINLNQYGFTRNKRTEHNLMELYNRMFQTYHKKSHMIIVFLDFTKAYDTVDVNKLLKIISKYGFKGYILDYLKNFLTGRENKVFYGNTYSKKSKLCYGLPQGSPLSPILFNLYTNEILKEISKDCKMRAFADDIMYYKQHDNIDTLENELNITTKKIYKMCLSFNIYMSPSKCKVLLVTNRKINKTPKIKLGKSYLEVVNKYKYLGFTIDNRLKCDSHIKNSIKKAKNRMNIIRFISNKIKGAKIIHIINMYKAFVRPILEYGFTILLTMTKSRIKKLESCQHLCLTKLLHINKRSSSISLLSTINMLTIENRLIILSVEFIKKSLEYNLNKLSMLKITRPENNIKKKFYSKSCIEQKLSHIYNQYIKTNKTKKQIKKSLLIKSFNDLKSKTELNKNTEFFVHCFGYMLNKNLFSFKKYCKLKNSSVHFYIKIMTGSLKLNYFLYKLKVVPSDKCLVCNCIETSIHKLFYCSKHYMSRKKHTNFKKIKNKIQQITFITDINKITKLQEAVTGIEKN